MQILAIDYGEKRMGFALGDKQTKTAVPLSQMICKNPADDIRTIMQIVDEFDVNTIIIGYPLNMNGTKNDITKKVENFAQNLKKKMKIEIKLVDERLSSFEAEEILKPIKKKYQNRKKKLDSISALVIMQNYFNKK
jgi:putative Holliday junction resolvase